MHMISKGEEMTDEPTIVPPPPRIHLSSEELITVVREYATQLAGKRNLVEFYRICERIGELGNLLKKNVQS